MKILLIENDTTLALTLKQVLQGRNRIIRHALTLRRAYHLIQAASFDLIIADRMLDDGDSFELAQFVQEISPVTKFIFLSQRGNVTERVSGLRAGADDYLAKPFNLEELLLKIDKLLKLEKLPPVAYLQAGEVILNPENGNLQVADRSGHLRRREAEILSCLIRYRGTVVSRQMLIEQIWKTRKDIPSFTTLDVYIRRLRLALGSRSGMIKTIRGFGYLIDC